MLTAKKSQWLEKILSIYSRNLIKRRFHTVRVENLECFANRDSQVPLVIYANHSSWWDGVIAYEIWRAARLDGYVMMEEKQLKDLRLFRRIGAFSVVRENPRKAVKSLNYAVDLLKDKENRAVWIFPQGAIRPSDERPLAFYQGLARVVEKLGRCAALPVALKFEFLQKFKPEVYVKIGRLRNFQHAEKKIAKELTGEFETELTDLLDCLKNDIAAENTASYKKLI